MEAFILRNEKQRVDKTILYNHLNGLIAVLLVDLHSVGRRDIVTAQKQHDFLDRFLHNPGFLDQSHALLGDSGNLDQTGARVLNDVERLQTEVSHNTPGRYRANALDETAPQVLLQPGERGGLRLLGMHDLELPSICEMLAPETGQAQRLAGLNVWKATPDGEEIAFPRCFEPGQAVA